MKTVVDGNVRTLDEALVEQTLYGYGVYTSFSVCDGGVAGWQYHLDRLRGDCLGFLGLEVSEDEICNNVMAFLDAVRPVDRMSCRVTIFPADLDLANPHLADTPRIVVTGNNGGGSVPDRALKLAVHQCDRPFAQHKVTAIGSALHVRGQAKSAGYDDALFKAGDDITEGATWNIFFVAQDGIYTPQLDGNLLPGVTRRLLSDLLGNELTELRVSYPAIHEFDGAFITNSSVGIVPVASIDDAVYSTDGSWVADIRDRYRGIDRTPIRRDDEDHYRASA